MGSQRDSGGGRWAGGQHNRRCGSPRRDGAWRMAHASPWVVPARRLACRSAAGPLRRGDLQRRVWQPAGRPRHARQHLLRAAPWQARAGVLPAAAAGTHAARAERRAVLGATPCAQVRDKLHLSVPNQPPASSQEPAACFTSLSSSPCRALPAPLRRSRCVSTPLWRPWHERFRPLCLPSTQRLTVLPCWRPAPISPCSLQLCGDQPPPGAPLARESPREAAAAGAKRAAAGECTLRALWVAAPPGAAILPTFLCSRRACVRYGCVC